MVVRGNVGGSIVVEVLRVYITCIGIERRKMAGIFLLIFFKKKKFLLKMILRRLRDKF